MNLRNIAFHSLNRQKGKRSFVLVAMALGCATVISLFSFINSQKKAIESQFDEYGANIIILPKSDNLGLSYGGVNISGVMANQKEIRLQDIDRIWQIPNKKNIRAVSPKLIGASRVENNGFHNEVLLVGVFFQEELRIKQWWEIDGAFPTGNGAIVVGCDVAQQLQINPGDSLSLDGNVFEVSGVLQPTGSQDDSIVFGDFNMVSTFLGREGAVSMAEVSALCSDCPIEQITAQIESVLPDASIKQIRQVMQQKMQSIEQFERFAFTVTFVLVAIGVALIFTSMMGSVSERRQEIGIFRALGFKKVHVVSIILTESFALSSIAGLIGTAAGYLISYLALPTLLNVERSAIAISPLVAGVSIPVVVFLGLGAGIYPALKAARIDPVTAINSL
jgi:putative ABC transport system permease protein